MDQSREIKKLKAWVLGMVVFNVGVVLAFFVFDLTASSRVLDRMSEVTEKQSEVDERMVELIKLVREREQATQAREGGHMATSFEVSEER